MLTYSQSSGEWKLRAVVLAVGYSGEGLARNTPAKEGMILRGPIPRGKYLVGKPFRFRGKLIMRLRPAKPTARKQRYYLHTGPESKGCINIPAEKVAPIARIVENGERELQVTV